jgi:diadenosine tetraphosphatase ApaH/serine/threonine PP2A family protein phosphatase
MRYAIISDIHGNGEALRAVFADIERASAEFGAPVDQIWCLGDIVGYGPEPGECVRTVRARCDVCIPGNHDWATTGRIDLVDFNGAAVGSAQWTRNRLARDQIVYLRSLPEVTRIGNFTLAHGSPTNPIWEYLISPTSAAPNFAAFDTTFCVVGHTHVPTIFLQEAGRVQPREHHYQHVMVEQSTRAMSIPGGPSWSALESMRPPADDGEWSACERLLPRPGLWMIPRGYRAIINPGSVGQPRDGDPRASYLIYDTQFGFEFRRVPYDVAVTQRKIQEAGLPSQLAARLAMGA